MFQSLLWGDVYKRVYELLNEGHIKASNIAFQADYRNSKHRFEVQSENKELNASYTTSFKAGKHIMVNKLFYNTSGECVVDFNIWNTAHNLAFTVLTQQNIRSTRIKKTAFGVKYIGEQFASDFAIDPCSHALSATTCYSINNFILGARFLGDKQSLLRSLDPLLIYETRGVAFFFSTENLFSTLHGAVLTEPFRNIRSGIFCDVSLARKATKIAFGLSMKPYRNCDLLVKVDAKGTMLATYRLYLSKSTTLWTSLETKMDSVFDSSLLRVSMEVHI